MGELSKGGVIWGILFGLVCAILAGWILGVGFVMLLDHWFGFVLGIVLMGLFGGIYGYQQYVKKEEKKEIHESELEAARNK